MVEFENTEETQKNSTLDASIGLIALTCTLFGWNEKIPDLKEHAETMFRKGARDGVMYGQSKKTFIKLHGALCGGVMSGVGFTTYYGVHDLLANKRGVVDVYNWVGAACAGSATLLLTYPGSPPDRVKRALTSTLVGVALAFPMNYVNLKKLGRLKSSTPNMNDSP